MYSLTVRDHIMIAHSFDSEVFGPAQNLHGATYVVDAEFMVEQLDENNLVIDIGLASDILKEVLSSYNYSNLDDHQKLKNILTTTEFLASHIHGSICERIRATFKGQLKITLHESHIAWASYTGAVE